MAHDTPLNLTKKISRSEVTLTFSSVKKEMQQYLKERNFVHHFLNDHQVKIEADEKEIPKLIFGISKTDIWITDIEIQKPSLEDVFLEIARK